MNAPVDTTGLPWTKDEFAAKLKAFEPYYHIHHPFQIAMNSGGLSKEAVQGWVLNRFYYQTAIPNKDAALLANCPDREVRRRWIQRIIDHDGNDQVEGGIERWIRLGEAVGLKREDIVSHRYVLPGVRFAVDAYVNFVRRASWQEGVASSLTELFAPSIHKERISEWPKHYPWIEQGGLDYFKGRVSEAHRDVAHGLGLTLDLFATRAEQERALELLKFKLDILWTMLDAMTMAYLNKEPPYFNVPGFVAGAKASEISGAGHV
jgi:pyrroloquinoline-quinone synthase